MTDLLPVHEAFAATMGEIGPVAKSQRNREQNYAFRGIDDVLNEVHSAMVNHGLFCLPTVLSTEYEWRTARSGADMVHVFASIRYDFYSADGSGPLSMVVATEGRDASDKATSKAMSTAYKYGLIQAFSIPVSDTDESDATTPESVGPSARREEPTPAPADDPESTETLPEGANGIKWTKRVAGVLAEYDSAKAQAWWTDAAALNEVNLTATTIGKDKAEAIATDLRAMAEAETEAAEPQDDGSGY